MIKMIRKIMIVIMFTALISGCSESVEKNKDNDELIELKDFVSRLKVENAVLLSSIEALEMKHDDVMKSNEELKAEIDKIGLGNELLNSAYEEHLKQQERHRDTFIVLSEIAHRFIKARIERDYDSLRDILHERYDVIEDGTDILIIDNESDEAIELVIATERMSKMYLDKVLRTQWYNPEEDTYFIGAVEYYDGEYLQVGYVNMTFTMTETGWKIVRLEFDI